MLKQSKFSDIETNVIKKFALQELHRQSALEKIEYVAVSLLEWYFLFYKGLIQF